MTAVNNFLSAQLSLLRDSVQSYASLHKSDLFILQHGWAPATTRQYAAAVNKYLSFLKSVGHNEKALPASRKLVYMFILWCSAAEGARVLSKTTSRYLTGLRMWHVLHDKIFPDVNVHRVRLLLKGCKKLEVAPRRPTRIGMTLRDMIDLCDLLTTGNSTDLVVRAILITGFWGLARLGELTFHPDHPTIFLRRRDVSFAADGKTAWLRVRMAKTAGPGEIQKICLKAQPNRLDPVNVLLEVLQRLPGSRNDPLFPGHNSSIPIRKSTITRFLNDHGPSDETRWGGHSLRIGGASLLSNLGMPVDRLKSVGRWRSSAYKSYIVQYPRELKVSTLKLASIIHF